MPPTHRKLRRKELKRPDEFTELFYDARDFVSENLTQVIVAAAVVAGVALIAVSTYYYERHRDRVTSAEFSTAFEAMDAKQYKTAEQGFLELAASEPGRELGRLARFYLATCYLDDNDLPRARDSLVGYLAEGHDPAFEGLALMDLGIVYERLADLEKAEGAYRQAAAMPGSRQASAQLAVARLMARRGDRAGAIREYREFLAAHPFARERGDVIEALAELGAPAESEPRAAAAEPGQVKAALP